MKRSLVREYAFMFLFQIEIQTENVESQIHNFLANYPVSDNQADFFESRVKGVISEKSKLDDILEPFLVKWTLNRLPKVDLTILRLAIFEMKYMQDIPNNVAISEAVRLAKKYSTDESRSYINAILGNVNREVLNEGKSE
ncbi:MAG TPA: transcription antitermination factor NusB [Clostridiaceae bacterium]|nr:transcription antitermination factor NusB [Clostridiaceae bacterium]